MNISKITSTAILAALALVSAIPSASAAVLRFDADPFAGSTALTTPGRQVFGGNERFVPFDVATDVAEFLVPAFGNGLDSVFSLFNGPAVSLPITGVNVVVLNDIDFDGNPSNGIALNAGQAATLIANVIDEVGAGLFVYFNSALNANRLVFSTDLSDANADLSVLARFTNQTGQFAIDTLPQYTIRNFSTDVPEPAAFAVMAAGLAMAGAALRRRAK